MTQRSTQHATFDIERAYDAAPARVFGAWSDPAAKTSWFGPAQSEERTLEFAVGGREHFVAEGPDGSVYTYDARYQEIVPERRIIYTYTMDRGETRISASLSTVDIEAAGEGTRLRYTEQAAYLDGGDTPDQREHGTREMLEKLDALLSGAPATD
jgi:uncharacterized protein YndB with AHSA1/START domain